MRNQPRAAVHTFYYHHHHHHSHCACCFVAVDIQGTAQVLMMVMMMMMMMSEIALKVYDVQLMFVRFLFLFSRLRPWTVSPKAYFACYQEIPLPAPLSCSKKYRNPRNYTPLHSNKTLHSKASFNAFARPQKNPGINQLKS